MDDLHARPPLAYELRIGVTGHRRLTNPDEVGAAVATLLAWIDRTLDHQQTTPLEWTIVSPLAKGADRVAARTALKYVNARLDVVTPFSLDDYRRDFDTAEDLAEFEELLAKANHITALDAERPHIASSEPAGVQRVKREVLNAGYTRVGRRMVDSCELLIAIWDGQPALGEGGTGDIVHYAVMHHRTVLWIDSRAPDKPARWLRPVHGTRLQDKWFQECPLPTSAKRLSAGYHQLTGFVRDQAASKEDVARCVRSTLEELEQAAAQAGLETEAYLPIARELLPYYARSDLLAGHYQRLYMATSKSLFFLAAAAVTSVVLQGIFFPSSHWPTVLEIVLLVVILAWLYVGRRAAWHEKWLHDRYLAERLRTALFSLLVEGSEHREAEPQKTLPFYTGPHNLLPTTEERIVARARAARRGEPSFDSVRRFLIDSWLAPQRAWHARNAHGRHQQEHRIHVLGITLFAVTLLIAFAHLLHQNHTVGHKALYTLTAWITFFAIVLPVWGSALHAVKTQLEHGRIADRSRRMSEALGLVIQHMEDAGSIEELRRSVIEAERMIATENLEWWILLSFRTMELPS